VNAQASSGWEAVMWQIINKNLPMFYLKVSPDGAGGQTFQLIDGLLYATGQPEDYLRLNGSYLVGDYTFSGEITDKHGFSSDMTVAIRFETKPEILDLDLVKSSDNKATWNPVAGDLASGFAMTLDPSVEWYYLNVENVVTNGPFKETVHPFFLDTYPADYFAYWNSRNVNASADPLTWQAVMWKIINKELPMFYLKVSPDGSGGQTFQLIDGLGYATGQPDDYLRINGTYLTGAYTFNGTIKDANDFENNLQVAITFEPMPTIDLDLVDSMDDKATWNMTDGAFATGFQKILNMGVPLYYLDVENVVTNKPLAETYHPFYIETYPAGFFAYWQSRGVYEGCTGVWEPVMWQIINGDLPIFYLKVSDNGIGGQTFQLIDGLLYALGQPDEFLRLEGTYLIGEYSYTGSIDDGNGGVSGMTVMLTLLRGIWVPFIPLN
jgi:hypothetical protein